MFRTIVWHAQKALLEVFLGEASELIGAIMASINDEDVVSAIEACEYVDIFLQQSRASLLNFRVRVW